jgi:hypothetical protein
MQAFDQQVLTRLPLAEAMWTLLRYVVTPTFASELFERHRGTGSERLIEFGTLVELVGEALTQHGGSGRQSFEAAKRDGRLAATVRAVYGKLGRIPARLSQAFLREATARLNAVLAEPTAALPASLREFHVVAVDGNDIKRVDKRLKVLRGHTSGMLGGKGVVALSLSSHLAIAMEASLNGDANDAPLFSPLLEQVEALLPQAVFYVADRQFCDLTIPPKIVQHGSHVLIRFSQKMRFLPDETGQYASRTSADREGRLITEEWGWLGIASAKQRMFVRRITLSRPDEEDVSLITDLLDAESYPAQDLLDTYLQRWTIERVFQQVTEVFQLQRLIGTTPQGTVFQFSLCLWFYNLMQVLRAQVADIEQRPIATISSELMFHDVCDQLVAGDLLLDRSALLKHFADDLSPEHVRARLRALLSGRWTTAWLKAPAKRQPGPRPQQPAEKGTHASVWKLIQAAKVAAHPP